MSSNLASLAEEPLPVESLKLALPHLRRPFTPEAIRFKVQAVFKDCVGCIIVSYVDARLVIERLNAVAADQWTAVYREAPNANHLWCDLRVFEVTHTDVGQSAK